jgi:excisionase family DNA binding protein
VNDELLSVRSTAKLLGVSSKTVRRWLASGRLASLRLGTRTLRVDGSSVTRLLADSTTKSRTAPETRKMPKARLEDHPANDNGRGVKENVTAPREVAVHANSEAADETPVDRFAATGVRVYRDAKGWYMKFYDAERTRRTERIPPRDLPLTATQEEAMYFASGVLGLRRAAALAGDVVPPKAKTYLYPDKEKTLLACKEVPLVKRLLYGVLARFRPPVFRSSTFCGPRQT